MNRYPDPQQIKVKRALSNIKNIPVENILLGNGSDEVLDLIFRVFCEPNQDNIITLPPTYGMYSVLSNINAVENRQVVLSESFQPKVNEILEKVDKNTKLLFLCSPNNPTGNSFSEETIEELLLKFRGLVVVDEAYIDFSDQESWLQRMSQFKNLIIIQTLSKAYGMAGIRLGICYASEEIIAILNKIKPPYNVNNLTQKKAIVRLSKEEEVNNEIVQLKSERKRLYKALKSIPFVEKVYTSDANFLLIKVDDAYKRYEELIAHGIVIRNRTTQPLCKNCLRISVGVIEESQKLIKILLSISKF